MIEEKYLLIVLGNSLTKAPQSLSKQKKGIY